LTGGEKERRSRYGGVSLQRGGRLTTDLQRHDHRAPSVRSSERLHGAIARQIGVAIVSGQYQPGDVLDNEVAFSEHLRVSRSAYREAVRMLAAKGLLDSRPKTGTRVSPRSRWNLLDPDVLSWFFEASDVSAEFVRDLFELRLIVEPAAAALAAERRTNAHLTQMRHALEAMQRLGLGVEEGRSADRDFHDVILVAARNAPLLTLTGGIGAAIRWTTIFKQRRGELPRDPMPDHWRVFGAIAACDASGASEAMRELVSAALADTRAEFES